MHMTPVQSINNKKNKNGTPCRSKNLVGVSDFFLSFSALSVGKFLASYGIYIAVVPSYTISS